MANNVGVHASHCCKWHGCKYGDKDCPVVSGEVEQLYPCMFCDDLLEDEEYFRQALEDIAEIKAFKERLKSKVCKHLLFYNKNLYNYIVLYNIE